MGKGDKKTKKGKIFRGSYGVRRPRKRTRIKEKALAKNPQDNAPDLQEKMTDNKAGKAKEVSKSTAKTSKSKSKAKSQGGSKKKEGSGEE